MSRKDGPLNNISEDERRSPQIMRASAFGIINAELYPGITPLRHVTSDVVDFPHDDEEATYPQRISKAVPE